MAAAAAQVGWPYLWGGESRAEGGFDCSGLVDYAFTAAGAPLSGRPTAADLWRMGRPIPAAELQPGDLVFVGTACGAPHHVGMYVGDGTVLSAPHTGARVRYEPLADGGWDGFASLLPAGPAPLADPVSAAARRTGVPGHALAAELRLGLASDPEAAAAGLARAQAAHPGSLQEALATRWGSRRRRRSSCATAAGPASACPGPCGCCRCRRAAQTPATTTSHSRERPRRRRAADPPPHRRPAGRGATSSAPPSTPAGTAEQLGERSRAVPLQAAAALQHLSRFGPDGPRRTLPDPDRRDASNLAGAICDTYSAVSDLVSAAAPGGLELTGAGLSGGTVQRTGRGAFDGAIRSPGLLGAPQP